MTAEQRLTSLLSGRIGAGKEGGQVFFCKACTEAGKEACEDSSQGQEGEISQDAGSGSDQEGGGELPHVVEQTSQGPGEKEIFPMKEFYGGGHDHKT